MSAALNHGDLLAFRDLVASRLGLRYEDDKLDLLSDALRRRIDATASPSARALLQRLLSPATAHEELRELSALLSVPETYFLRYSSQFDAFAEVAVRERMLARGADRRLRILSAGCASGEEAHSLAIVLRERVAGLEGWDVAIHGIDINPVVLERAAQGRYSPWSLRSTPPAIQARYFQPSGRDFVLCDAIRAMATFEERNLVDPDPSFWRPAFFDVVFCRNVLMYFEPDAARAVVSRIAQSLAPGGFLFMGHAETLRGVSHDFHLRHTHETFYYQRAGAEARAALTPPTSSWAATPAAPVAESADAWVETIRRASEKIAALAHTPRSPSPAVLAVERHDLHGALALLRQERFPEALAALPPAAQSDPEGLLLRAVLLTNAGAHAEAEATCETLLAVDEMHAGAHYLRALCREHAGDLVGAIACDETAVHLDATFAMAQLHLGLMARRAGRASSARTALRRALPLLEREDEARIVLYGGGFRREALEQLCRAELRAAEASR